MPPSGTPPGSPLDWLRHAASDLAVAEQAASPAILYETLCYHAQQAAEKSLKAVLVHAGTEFPYTHSIARLITVVQEAGVNWPTDLDEAAELTEYAVWSRYPGAAKPVTESDLQRSIAIATSVLSWAEKVIVGPSS